MPGRLQTLVLDPYPLRTVSRRFIRRTRIGSYESRVRIGAVDRPHYGWCVFQAASLAQRLGYPRISVLEFGVAGGNGLVNLEQHAREAEDRFGVGIEIYGFDTGEGLPEPVDYRDLPYQWKEGFYRMDVEALRARLKRAELVLGDVRKTARTFFGEHSPAPIGAISYDLDFHSSTAVALEMLLAGDAYHLPRVFSYFDDTVGDDVSLYNDFTGQRLAIHEFNAANERVKLGAPYNLLAGKVVESWHHQIWVAHFFDHPDYTRFVADEGQELRLRA